MKLGGGCPDAPVDATRNGHGPGVKRVIGDAALPHLDGTTSRSVWAQSGHNSWRYPPERPGTWRTVRAPSRRREPQVKTTKPPA